MGLLLALTAGVELCDGALDGQAQGRRQEKGPLFWVDYCSLLPLVNSSIRRSGFHGEFYFRDGNRAAEMELPIGIPFIRLSA
jgi:hypothetical protein